MTFARTFWMNSFKFYRQWHNLVGHLQPAGIVSKLDMLHFQSKSINRIFEFDFFARFLKFSLNTAWYNQPFVTYANRTFLWMWHFWKHLRQCQTISESYQALKIFWYKWWAGHLRYNPSHLRFVLQRCPLGERKSSIYQLVNLWN